MDFIFSCYSNLSAHLFPPEISVLVSEFISLIFGLDQCLDIDDAHKAIESSKGI